MPLKPLVVINVVGLTPSLLGEHTPYLNALIEDGFIAKMEGVFPAVTCTAQASMLTGTLPRDHGIVANGWYSRQVSEVGLWRQSNRLVEGEKIWHSARKTMPDFSCTKIFWWNNMYADVNFSVTPRPIYPADGRKIPGLYSSPAQLHEELTQQLGVFPFFNFWGPKADIKSSTWIAACAQELFRRYKSSLTLVYLPHLDYNLQRLGPKHLDIDKDVRAIDAVAGKLIESVRAGGADVMVVSEYGIEPATGHVHINRILRDAGYLSVQKTLDWELLDFGASRAFAVADHQAAHVYIKNPEDINSVAKLLATVPGIERVLTGESLAQWGLDHPRSGELVLVAEPGHWFTYYYWLDESMAPDFARTVDIHRKPGYDPVELFLDPDLMFPKLKIATRVLQKKLGQRMLMDVIPLKPELVKGTHGRREIDSDHGPLLISTRKDLATDRIAMQEIKNFILKHWR